MNTTPKRDGDTPPIDDAVWESLAHGELSDDEVGFLKALAEADPSAEEHVAAYQPLAAPVVENIARAAEQSLARHRQKRRRTLFGAATGALAMAAAVLLMVRSSDVESALPAYDLRLSQGVAQVRGSEEPTGLPHFEPDTELDLIAVPASRVTGEVEARAYLVRGTEITLLAATFRREVGGAVRWKGPARELLTRGPGRFRIAIVVGAPLPDEGETRTWVAQGDRRVMFRELEYTGP